MQTILQHLYKKKSLQEVDVETLEQLTQQHPYFAIGHYLLAKKLGSSGDNDSRMQLQKALVYFHNPLWLQYQLSQDETTADDSVFRNESDTSVAIDSVNEIPATQVDLIEEVTLHQESVHATAEEMPDGQTEDSENVLAQNSSNSNSHQINEDGQIVQQPERFSFQAYHTVDYFASQGIRLNREVQVNDKLGKQLRSFTEWLKTMRRLPESVAEEVLDKVNDGEVVQFAAHSLEGKEVLTEAMAEVLVKQEKFDKAKDVYHKLSLLHPHKNAYFAAKIDDLKRQL